MRHNRPTKIFWNLVDSKSKSRVPSQRDAVSEGKLTQDHPDCAIRKRRVSHQQLDIPVQLYWTVHLRFDLRIEHSARLALGRFAARPLELPDDVVQQS